MRDIPSIFIAGVDSCAHARTARWIACLLDECLQVVQIKLLARNRPLLLIYPLDLT
jgi:hypothetical protein